MGIPGNGVKMIHRAWKDGVKLGDVLTIGQLNLSIHRHHLHDLLAGDDLCGKDDFPQVEKYTTEELLRLYGANSVQSLDYSNYEGCGIVHDLNKPFPEKLKHTFDAVIEGGTTEHIFNPCMSLKNCADAVKVGGRLFIFQMGPNNGGHGFFSFSPEWFFRALSPEYGFEIELLLLYEWNKPDTIFSVKDTTDAHFFSKNPTRLLIQAKRVGIGKSFLEEAPNQLIFSKLWEQDAETRKKGRPRGNPSFLHGRPWYEKWKWRRYLRRKMRKMHNNLGVTPRNLFTPFSF